MRFFELDKGGMPKDVLRIFWKNEQKSFSEVEGIVGALDRFMFEAVKSIDKEDYDKMEWGFLEAQIDLRGGRPGRVISDQCTVYWYDIQYSGDDMLELAQKIAERQKSDFKGLSIEGILKNMASEARLNGPIYAFKKL